MAQSGAQRVVGEGEQVWRAGRGALRYGEIPLACSLLCASVPLGDLQVILSVQRFIHKFIHYLGT